MARKKTGTRKTARAEQAERSDRNISTERGERAAQAEHAASAERDPHSADINHAEPSERAAHWDHTEHAEWTEHIRAIAHKVFEQNMETIRNMIQEELRSSQHIRSIPSEDMPPEPQYLKGQKGRREARDWRKLTITVDRVLAKRFQDECTENKLSAGKMMDAILWARYGKPKLSYQLDPEGKSRPKRTKTTTETAE
ncbi:MAG: hypothetical protein AB1646_21210 [Thermodesulfobacteriota bacterium]